MGQDVWLDLLPGLLLVVAAVVLVKGGSGWYMFRRSIYKEVYSNYLEYVMRKKSLKKLSQSYYFDSRFGAHRIIYQLAAAKGEKIPQAYVVIILKSGVYILDIKNQTGEIEASEKGDFKYHIVKKGKKGEKPKIETKIFKNPVEEVQYFQKRLFQKLDEKDILSHSIIVFPNSSTLNWKENRKPEEAAVIYRKEVFDTIKNIHGQQPEVLSEEEIERIYLALAGEMLEEEKR